MSITTLRKYSRITPGQRHRIGYFYPRTSNLLLKKLHCHKQRHAGRNNTGKITVQGQGGGNYRTYKIIDFKGLLWDELGMVKNIVYDRNRTALLNLIIYNNGLRSYKIATEGSYIGQIIQNGYSAPIEDGNSLPLISIPTGIPICLINGVLCRRAGTYRKIIKKDYKLGMAIIKLRSGIYKGVDLNAMATIGKISNGEHQNCVLGKAGMSRWLGIRPTVRGVAKNPVDHPHGGGNGKTSGGRPSVTPNRRCTKGAKTRRKRNTIRHQTTFSG
jgi:large subunit ribosomal protein L2